MSVAVRCMVKVKEEYFKTKYRPVGILLYANTYLYTWLTVHHL